jgi:uncharacterized protein (DUF2147 family)
MYKWTRTIALASLLFASAAMAAAPAAPAAADLVGIWQGKLAVDPKNSLTIQFTFAKDAKGAYTAVLNSPDNGGIKNTPATGVTFDGSNVKLQVAALSGSYAGTLKDGKINGQWTQPGGALPLVLSPYQKPVLTKAAMDTLTGTWFGPLKLPGNRELTFVLRFKTSDKGEFGGTLAVPEQGGNEIPASDIQFTDGKLAFKIPLVSGDFSAAVANGVMTGAWKQPGPGAPPEGMPISLKKGEYAAQVYALKLSTEAFAALSGTWKGKLELTSPQGQKVSLAMVLRFATSPGGQFIAFIDSPDQKAMNIPVTDASFANGKLSVKVAAVQGEYNATLSGQTLTGQWTQGPLNTPLVLTR